MVPTEGLRSGAGSDDNQYSVPDLPLTSEERSDLALACADLFSSQTAADRVLERIGFPRAVRPSFQGTTSLDAWTSIFLDLERGIISQPYRRILEASLLVYAHHAQLRALGQRHGLVPQDGQQQVPVPQTPTATSTAGASDGQVPVADGTDQRCHVIVQVETEDQAQQARHTLDSFGLQAEEFWSTAHAVSYRVSGDASTIRRQLHGTQLGWTLVPPGHPDYLLHSLYVAGPDGRQFRIADAPAQQTIGNIASQITEQQYPQQFAEARRPTVVDHVGQDGQGARLDPESTLHDAGVQDGDELRVAFQATAGAVNPLDRQDALYRVRNELIGYANAHKGFTVRADSALLPMRYLLGFRTDSWRPADRPGGEPIRTDRHVVELILGPEFPMTPPSVFWRSPIFHPNVAPMYDTAERKIPAGQQGMVCLGLLAESYQPSLSFADLCQTLVDMAAFRNYGLVERTGEFDADGVERTVANVYDAVAKRWVENHPERILEIGGVLQPDLSSTAQTEARGRGYPNVIEIRRFDDQELRS